MKIAYFSDDKSSIFWIFTPLAGTTNKNIYIIGNSPLLIMKQADKIQKIRKEAMIGEIVEKYPEAVPALMDLGLHCIGCHAAGFESLEMGLKAHGMDDKQIVEAVKKLNEAIGKK